jgi:WD40 repeat protein/uncharacterized caspase-like protein
MASINRKYKMKAPFFALLISISSLSLYAVPGIEVQMGHASGISSVSVSPDGKYAVSGSADATLKLWAIANGKEVMTFRGHTKGIESVCFSSDGRHVISGSSDATIKLWDITTGKEIRTFLGHSQKVNAVKLSHDNKHIISGSNDGTLRLWDASNGKEIMKMECKYDIRSVDISPDDKYAVCGEYKTLRLWDLGNGKEIRSYSGHSDYVLSVNYSPDGKSILSGSDNGELKLWDIASGKEAQSFSGHQLHVLSVCFSPDGKYAISCGQDRSLRLWDISSGKPIRTFYGHTHFATSVCFSANGQYAISGSADKTIKLWEIASGAMVRTLSGCTSGISSLDLSFNGRYLASGSGKGVIQLWDINQGKATRKFLGHSGAVNSVCFSPDSKYLVSGSDDKTVKLWDVESGKEIRTFSGHTFRVCSVCMSSDDQSIFSTQFLSTAIKIWDAKSGKEIRSIKAATPGDSCTVSLSSDGKYAISGLYDSLIMWETANGRQSRTFNAAMGSVYAASFSPDGRYAISGGADQKVRLWDIASGKAIKTYPGHTGTINSIGFSPSGKQIVSGSADGTIKIWDTASGRLIKTLIAHTDSVRSVRFSPDGNRIASGSLDGTLRLWDANDFSWIAFLGAANNADWLNFTQDGYWDGTRNSGALVAMTQGLEAWGIDQFAVRNNRPDIILQRLGSADTALIDHYRAQYGKRLRRMGLTESNLTNDYRVPSATIVDARKNDKFVDLSIGFIADGKPLKRYQVFVNDVPLYGSLGKPLSGDTATVKERVELAAGENKIEASCMDSGGAESFRANQVFSWKGEAKHDLYFLAFGVSTYQDPAIRSLRYSAKDVRDLETAFKKMEGKGFNKVVARTYTDAQVTKSSIIQAKDFLKGARPDDTLVLFISGHGIQIGGSTGDTLGGENGKGLAVAEAGSPRIGDSTYYYVTADARLSDIPGTAADFEAIEDLLQGIAPRQKLFLMDTCESGEADEESPRLAIGASGTKGLFARTLAPESRKGIAILPKAAARAAAEKDRYIYNDLVRRSGAIVFSSCLGNEASLESDAWQQGAFTAKILASFTDPAADANHDCMLSTDELRAYVTKEVPRLVKSLDPAAEQHPTVDRDNLYVKFAFPTAALTASRPVAAKKEPADPRKPYMEIARERTSDGWYRFAAYQESMKYGGISRSNKYFVLKDARHIHLELIKISGSPELFYGVEIVNVGESDFKILLNSDKYLIEQNGGGSLAVRKEGSLAGQGSGKPVAVGFDYGDGKLVFSIDDKPVHSIDFPAFVESRVEIKAYNDLIPKRDLPLSEAVIEVRMRQVP